LLERGLDRGEQLRKWLGIGRAGQSDLHRLGGALPKAERASVFITSISAALVAVSSAVEDAVPTSEVA
jgi:hypothetical protein